MKTVSRINNVQRNGVKKSTKCGIVVNAKAFDMLARQYSDPIKAILQELGANAADSHVRAGKEDVPFSVKIPNALDPHLRIRDYGVGMTEDVVYDVYINYMKSDKTSTNSETGCFGIGSKTPLSYADQFNITTYNDGLMTMYALVKSEDGVPELNEFGSWDTEEENGVEISFSVKEDDFQKFEDRAVDVYKYFKTRPNITGGEAVYPERNYVLKGDTWWIAKGHREPVVIMGNVAYPVDSYQFDYDSKEREFLYNNCGIEVPIGDLNVTPSRESLEYTEHTINGIKNAISRVMDEIALAVADRFVEAKSWWQAKAIQREICREIHGIGSLQDLTMFDGRSLDEYPELHVRRVFTMNGSKVKASNFEYKKRIEVRSDVRVVVQDTETRFDKNCRYLCATEDTTVYLVSTDMTMDQVKEELGVCDSDKVLMLSSELPEAPKPSRTNSGNTGYARKKTTSVRVFSPTGGSYTSNRYQSRWWDEEEVDIKDDTTQRLYISWFNYECTFQDGQRVDIRSLHRAFEDVGIAMPPICGMKENQIKRVSKKDHWMSVEDWATKAFEVYMEENNAKETLRLHSLQNKVDWVCDLAGLLGKQQADISEDCLLGQLMSLIGVNNSKESAEKILAISRLIKYNVDNDDKDTSSQVEQLSAKCEEKYPFLVSWIRKNYIQHTENDCLLNLIQMVESLDRCN
jgi:hypothetical protein